MPKIEGEDARSASASAKLARRLGVFDAVMIVMGGIVGSGIFVNPYVVARQVHTVPLILGAWVAGGLMALAGAFIYAELASLKPDLGGQYAYLREAYHPSVAFLYGWALLFVIQTGGMAGVAVTFAHYFREIVPTRASDSAIAIAALIGLTLINCLGVRSGSTVQSILMILKIGAIAILVGAGFLAAPSHTATAAPLWPHTNPLFAFAAAVTPVFFAYGGWQTASFMAGEMRDPRRDLSRAMLIGVLGVITIYLAVNIVCLRVLGTQGLAATTAPAFTVMQRAVGQRGALFMSITIGVSTLGFLSQGMLTAPRVYFAMAQDGLFFRWIAWVPKATRAPAAAILMQGALASVIALSGEYEQILNYVVSMDFIFFGLTGASLFIFRKRLAATGLQSKSHATPGHPYTTIFFVAVCWLVVLGTFYNYPKNSFTGLGLLLLGVPVYLFWSRRLSN
ncbi:MAG TPA: amino acid permease [Bryobacteraceae bacterium]|jgi:APA family basic amino acid/polyamine antiporter|nr:amino acid permease [Bryobacteraceae bacterium]